MKYIFRILVVTALLFHLSCKKQITNTVTEVQWSNTYGGSDFDFPYACAEGKNGTVMVVGYTKSSDGDVTDNECLSQITTCVRESAWILNISNDGNKLSQHTFGKAPLLPPTDYKKLARTTSITATSEGGWLIGGQTNTIPSNTPSHNLQSCKWLIKLKNTGDPEWTNVILKAESDRSNDSVSCVINSIGEDGYLLSGVTVSSGDGAQASITKVDKKGREEWTKLSSGTAGRNNNKFNSIITSGDSYIAVGQTASAVNDNNSNNSGLTKVHGGWDAYILKVSKDGSSIPENNIVFGGESDDVANAIVETTDGYLIVGETNSISQDAIGNHSGKYDAWVLKLDKTLKKQWHKTYGGAFGDETAKSIVKTSDGNFVIAGQTSSNDGDVSGNHGNTDAWVIKIDIDGNLLWQQTLGGSGADGATNIITTSDGNLLVTGYTFSYDGNITSSKGYGGDFWVVKIQNH